MKLRIKWEHIILSLLISAVSVNNIVWLIQDRRPQPVIDPYATKTLRFIGGLNQGGLENFFPLLDNLHLGARPPLYQIFSIPFGLLFGRSVDALLGINIFFGIVLLLATYGIGKLVSGGKVGLLAALLVGVYPPVLNLSKIYMPKSVLPACTALSIWLLLLFFQKKSSGIAWLYGASIGLGVLIHPNFFCIVPGLIIVFFIHMLLSENSLQDFSKISIWRKRVAGKLHDPIIWKSILPAMLIAAVLAAMWYIPHLNEILSLARQSSANYAEVQYGFYNIPISFWWYARTMPGAISNFFTLLLAVSLVVNIIRRKRYQSLLVLIFALVYCGLSLRGGAVAWMNFAPILPIAAVLTASLIADVRIVSRSSKLVVMLQRIAAAFFTLLGMVTIGVAGFIFYAVNWESPAGGHILLEALGSPGGRTCEWRMTVALCPNPPRRDNWMQADVIKHIMEDRGTVNTYEELAVVNNTPNFTHSSLQYYLAQDYPKANFYIRPIINPIDWPKIRDYYINWLIMKYVVFIITETETFQYAEAVVSFLEDPSTSFGESHLELGRFNLPDSSVAVLLKRIKPPNAEELTTSIEKLDVSENIKCQLMEKVETWLDGR